MKAIPYPTLAEINATGAEEDFRFPEDLGDELRAKFSEWGALHAVLKESKRSAFWVLLHTYCERLRRITAEDVIEASDNHWLDELVTRARDGIELRDYISNLTKRYPALEANEYKNFSDA
jgi:hypothetical protein